MPLKYDFRDACHEKIPEDHAADAWFDASVAHYEKNLPLMQMLGGMRGPMRPV